MKTKRELKSPLLNMREQLEKVPPCAIPATGLFREAKGTENSAVGYWWLVGRGWLSKGSAGRF